MITLEHIQDEYAQALLDCFAILPQRRWALMPSGVALTTHKTKYGMANHTGKVFISHGFLNTTAFTKLRNTLRHELAHLAVGLRHQHDAVFRRCERAFGAKTPVPADEIEQVHSNVPYKWRLLAHLFDGSVRDIGGAHRRTKKYTEYRPQAHRFMSVDGEKIRHFEFIATKKNNREDAP